MLKRAAQMLERRQRFAASLVAVAALVVVVLFAFGEILEAQEQRVTLILCSHPGASRDFDGSLLNRDPLNGDSFSTHPTVGEYRGSVNEGGIHPNLAWATYNYWGPLIEVTDAAIDELLANQSLNADTTIPCVLHAQFRINNRIAIAQYGPCVPVDRDGDGRVDIDPNNQPYVSIRVWLNNSKVTEHETIPCDSGIDYELPGQTEPVPFQRPPGLTTTQSPNNSGGGGGGGGGGGSSDTDGSGTPDEGESGGDGTPGKDESTNGNTSGDGDSTEGVDSDGQEDSTEESGTPGVGAGGASADEDSSTDESADKSADQQQQDNADEQERDQEDSRESTSSQASAGDDETSEPEDDAQADDLLEAEAEAEGESDAEAQDLMEQEDQAAEETRTQTTQVEEAVAEAGDSGRTGPRVPGTGTGGVVDSKGAVSWQVVLGVSLGSAATIALLLLGFNRRSTRRTG